MDRSMITATVRERIGAEAIAVIMDKREPGVAFVAWKRLDGSFGTHLFTRPGGMQHMLLAGHYGIQTFEEAIVDVLKRAGYTPTGRRTPRPMELG